MKTPSMDRRTVLRGLGGIALSLPWLEAMASPGAAAPPMRMVCIGTSFGFVPDHFFPTEAGGDFEAPLYLKPLEQYRDRYTVFSQLDHGSFATGGHGGVHAFLSGILSSGAKNFSQRNISVDQVAASHIGADTRYSSMQFCPEVDPNNTLSWTSAGVAIPPVEKLRTIFEMLFVGTDPAAVDRLHRQHDDRASILDLVRQDAKRLESEVSAADKVQLDHYFTSVRALERRLAQSRAWVSKPKPGTDYVLHEGADELNFIDRVPLFYDLIRLALQTDTTRVVSFELSRIGKNSGGFPITRDYHRLTHHGMVESYLDELIIIEQYHMQQFARFVDELLSVKEDDGSTLLDNTMVLLGSGLGNGSSHSNRDIPLLLAGGGFRHGQHLRFDKDASGRTVTPASNLFLSMLQRFGVETDEFNLATGTLTGLEFA